ncbi:hypothetical protein [Glutamicibacter ardleyensis]|uniref:hypothetical protein n=1 Tax=Glutamicibacter ardleyensis TaxID=225894 RepID=UPI003FD60C18
MSAGGVARPVWARALPWPLSEMGEPVEALKTLFGEDLSIKQRGTAAVVYTPGTICHCLRCDHELETLLDHTPGFEEKNNLESTMRICSDCGDKRCAQGRNHQDLCDQDPFVKELKRELP